MIFNQTLKSQQVSRQAEENVVRKENSSSFSNDNNSLSVVKTEKNDQSDNTHETNHSQDEAERNDYSKASKADRYFYSYSTSLLLSQIAHALYLMAMQNAYNKQQEDKSRKEEENKQPKFTSKNHQINNSHLTAQTPMQL